MSTTEWRVWTSVGLMTISVIFAYRERFSASLFSNFFMCFGWHRVCKAKTVNRKKCAQIQALYANGPRKVGMNTTGRRVEKWIESTTTPVIFAYRRRFCAAFFLSGSAQKRRNYG